MNKPKNYNHFFALKRAVRLGKEITHNGKKIEKIDFADIVNLAGFYISVWYEDEPDNIYADLLSIEIK